jgi:hypothetical protein
MTDLHEWFPMIDSHPKYRERFNRFRHTWGLKRYYHERKVEETNFNSYFRRLRIF